MANKIKKTLIINKNKFTLEIYPDLRNSRDKDCPFWEIFPHDYHAALFAFSNKYKLDKLIKEKYVEEK